MPAFCFQKLTRMLTAERRGCQHDNYCPHFLRNAVPRRRCCWTPAPAAVDRYLLPARAQQQTRRRRTDARTFHRPCYAYHRGSVSKRCLSVCHSDDVIVGRSRDPGGHDGGSRAGWAVVRVPVRALPRQQADLHRPARLPQRHRRRAPAAPLDRPSVARVSKVTSSHLTDRANGQEADKNG